MYDACQRYWKPFLQLLAVDLYVGKKLVLDKLINVCIWVAMQVLVSAYLLPFFGLAESYGIFLLAGCCASAGLFEIFPGIVRLVDDITGNQLICHQLLFPLPSWLVILRIVIYNATQVFMLGMCIVPFGKLLLWDRFDLRQMSLYKFVIIFALASMFYGAYMVLVAALLGQMRKIGNIWARFVNPLWFLGCYQFSWISLYDISPTLAYLNFLNPMTYIMEGTRAAVLGQEGYLNFWFCLCMLVLLCIFTTMLGIQKLTKRLDIV